MKKQRLAIKIPDAVDEKTMFLRRVTDLRPIYQKLSKSFTLTYCNFLLYDNNRTYEGGWITPLPPPLSFLFKTIVTLKLLFTVHIHLLLRNNLTEFDANWLLWLRNIAS